MAVYGRQADVIANQGRGVNLYIPGKTQFQQGDVFLGGTGTGVTDEQLNGAQRVFGNTAEDTASAYGGFLKGSQSQARPAQQQSQFRLPPGARPTLAMRSQMAGEDQANRNFDLQQKSFDWGKARDEAAQKLNVGQMMGTYDGQDTLSKQSFNAQNAQNQFSNDLNVGQLMGTYGGQDTLAKQAQAIQQAQFAQSLAVSRAKAAAPKSISQSSLGGKTNMDNAIIEIDNQLSLGTKPGDIAFAIEQQGEALAKQGINVTSLLKSVWEMAGIQTKPEEEDSWR